MLDEKKGKLLLHICCAGCGAYVSQLLSRDYEVSLFYYNPNIYSKEEYIKRRKDVEKIASKFDLPLIFGEYDHANWLSLIKGHELDKERGTRCFICYEDRLRMAAIFAVENNFDKFTSTLTVSPHKVASKIIEIGNALAGEYGIAFLDQDFKKQDGFKKSVALSAELGLYRQNYCGCEFSLR